MTEDQMSEAQYAELQRWCRVFHAEAKAFLWRNLFCLAVAAWFCWATWPWLCGFAEIARYWIGGHWYKVVAIALGGILGGCIGYLRNKRKAVSA